LQASAFLKRTNLINPNFSIIETENTKLHLLYKSSRLNNEVVISFAFLKIFSLTQAEYTYEQHIWTDTNVSDNSANYYNI